MGEVRNAYKILVGEPEGKGPRGRTCRRWKDNMKTYLRKTGWEVVEWIHQAQDRDQWRALVKALVKLRVP
jgi:hypothetical protein